MADIFGLGHAVLEPLAGRGGDPRRPGPIRRTWGLAALTGARRDYDVETTLLGFRTQSKLNVGLPLIAGTPIAKDAFLGELGLDYRASDTLTIGLT